MIGERTCGGHDNFLTNMVGNVRVKQDCGIVTMELYYSRTRYQRNTVPDGFVRFLPNLVFLNRFS